MKDETIFKKEGEGCTVASEQEAVEADVCAEAAEADGTTTLGLKRLIGSTRKRVVLWLTQRPHSISAIKATVKNAFFFAIK